MPAAERRWGTGGWCSGVVWWGGLGGSEVAACLEEAGCGDAVVSGVEEDGGGVEEVG